MKKIIITNLIISRFIFGCTSFAPVPNTPTQKYVIVYDNTTTYCLNHNTNTIYISPTTALAPYNTINMYYSYSDYSINQYAYSSWATLPSNYINQAITQAITNSCLFNQVYNNEFNNKTTNFRLTSTINQIQQQVNNNQATVTLIIMVQLVNNSNNKPLRNQFIESTIITPSPQNMAIGTSKNVEKFTNELIKWLKNTIN